MTKITAVTIRDIRFPTSRNLDGSDAMNPDPDYSAAYVVLKTDKPGLEGHGLTFTSVSAPSCALRRRRRWRLRSSGATSPTSPATWASSGAASPSSASCAGSGRRRACCTSRPRRW